MAWKQKHLKQDKNNSRAKSKNKVAKNIGADEGPEKSSDWFLYMEEQLIKSWLINNRFKILQDITRKVD